MPKVSLFIPCLVDHLYPEMGISLCKLLAHLGFEVTYNPDTGCCGQPAFNAGQLPEARTVARQALSCLDKESEVVCPSGSCTAMIRNFYPELFEGEPESEKAHKVSRIVFELSEFLAKYNLFDRIKGSYSKKIAFHNSCHSARELNLRTSYRKLFEGIKGVQLLDPSPEPVCCGFGGLFCQKFQEVARGMAKSRLEMCKDTGADLIVSNDPGCIMHMRTQAKLLNVTLPIVHTTEFLVEALGI